MSEFIGLQSGLHDPTPNLVMRQLRNRCYGADIDYRWVTYDKRGHTKTLAVFEWKHQNQTCVSMTGKNSYSLRYGCDLADEVSAPFFIGITFTKDEHDRASRECREPKLAARPTIYLLPGNQLAQNAIAALPFADPQFGGAWCAAAELVALRQLLETGKPGDPDAIRPWLPANVANLPKIDPQRLAVIFIHNSVFNYSASWCVV